MATVGAGGTFGVGSTVYGAAAAASAAYGATVTLFTGDKGRLIWITTLISTSENRDAAEEPDTALGTRDTATEPEIAPENGDAVPPPAPAPQPTSEMNHLDWVGVLLKDIGQILKEYIIPAGPSQYTPFIETINADNNQETVGSIVSMLRNFKSMINGPMQAHVSAVINTLQEEMREMREEMIRELESQGLVSKTHSLFNSPIWPVRKSDGEWRLTVDYHALNEVTALLSAAMPDTLKLQYELESKAANWSTTIDIINAFFCIPLAAECRPQFAFTWRGVQYIWN
ncbi:hypothetical protein TURU_036487 [Turdus rufiventris]|nr:hypothetical protein TURU_036487 [Turdus rufiventris]